MILFWRERQKLSVSAVYYPIKIAEILKQFCLNEGFVFFPGCMCPLTKKPSPTWPPYQNWSRTVTGAEQMQTHERQGKEEQKVSFI